MKARSSTWKRRTRKAARSTPWTSRRKLIDPDLGTVEVPLKQVGPGQYQAVDPRRPAGHLPGLAGRSNNDQPMGQMTLGLVVPYSPEYRAGGANRGLLDELARITGGGPLTEPVQAFLHNLPAAGSAREIWRTLLLIAALLFPIDVALRRLIISRRDMQTARAWVIERLPGRRRTAGEREAPILGRLFNARERARTRSAVPPAEVKPSSGQRTPPASGPVPPPEQPSEKSAQPPAQQTPPADSLARLREAKKRARR